MAGPSTSKQIYVSVVSAVLTAIILAALGLSQISNDGDAVEQRPYDPTATEQGRDAEAPTDGAEWDITESQLGEACYTDYGPCPMMMAVPRR